MVMEDRADSADGMVRQAPGVHFHRCGLAVVRPYCHGTYECCGDACQKNPDRPRTGAMKRRHRPVTFPGIVVRYLCHGVEFATAN
jgi:CDGSH-type Zn-finger protein